MARQPVPVAPCSVGSLFSGGGLIDLGLERAGWRVAWQSEVDPYASSVLRKHWPDTPNLGDVRGVAEHGAPRVELLAGGFPCQDLSSAGKQAGLDGERSGLWFEYAKIIQAIHPRFVLIENVARLRHNGLDRVLRDLADRGYDAEWDVLSAASVGAPHLRERLWIVAWDATRVRVPDAFGERVREQRERDGEQRREPRADEPRDDGASQRVAHVADGDGGRRARLGAPHDDDGDHAPGDVADGRGADVADAVRTGREGLSSGSSRAWREAAPGHGGTVSDAWFRVFDATAYAAYAERCVREVWPRAPRSPRVEPGLGRASDGDPAGLDARPADPWERDTPRSLTPAEAAERRLLGEVRSARLKVIGNSVVPQIVEFIGQRLQILRSFSADS